MADSKWSYKEGVWSRTVDGAEETTVINPHATESAIVTALELGVDINAVKGTGKDGSVTKGDVEAAAK